VEEMGKILRKPKQVVVYFQHINGKHMMAFMFGGCRSRQPSFVMIIRTRMIAMVMDMIHEVKKASTADAVVQFPNRFLSKNAQRNVTSHHPSIHSSLGEKGSNKKTSTNTTPPHSCWLFLGRSKKGLPFFLKPKIALRCSIWSYVC